MSGREWLKEQRFDFSEMDGELYFTPMDGYGASVAFFESVFWPVLDTAIQNNTSTYEALMNVPGGTRGWEIYFEDWKQRGILN